MEEDNIKKGNQTDKENKKEKRDVKKKGKTFNQRILEDVRELDLLVPKEIKEKYKFSKEKYKNQYIYCIGDKKIQDSESIIIYVHGGAYFSGITKENWNFAKSLAKDLKYDVYMPDYPLIPKYNYKDVFSILIPWYKKISKANKDKHIILIGDSAGGGISLALYQSLIKEEYDILPKKTILISPWLDIRMENKRIDKIQKYDRKLLKPMLKLAGKIYSSDEDQDNFLVNPIDGPLQNLKQVYIFTGTYDILNPDVHLLRKKAKQEDTKIKVYQRKKAAHIWILDKDKKKEFSGKEDYEKLLEVIKREE